MTEAVGGSAWATAGGPLRGFLELLGLTGLVVARPVLSTFGDSPETFVGYDAGTLDVVAFAAAVALGPPVMLWLLEQLVGLASAWARWWVHLLAVFALLTGLAIQVGKEATDLGYKRLPLLAAGVALVATVVIARVAAARLFLRFLAVAPVAFALLFLFASPVGAVAFSSPGAGADLAEGIEVGRPAPVVMVVLDELPTVSLLDARGAIDRRSYPHLARFAEDSTWYRNHTTVAQQTEQAVPALLTGVVPSSADVAPIASEYERSLFSLLADSYDVRASEAATALCARGCASAGRTAGLAVPALLEDAWSIWRLQASPKRDEAAAELARSNGAFLQSHGRAPGDVDAFVESLGTDEGRPRLDFLHIMLPHQPWHWLPDGTSYESVPGGAGLGRWPDEALARAAQHRHLLQVAFVDGLVGRVLDRLRRLGTYEESLVIIAADHGISFQGGAPARVADQESYAEVLWTPLLVKAPGQRRGSLNEAGARSVDVVPTIADHLDVDLPWDVDGRSLLRALEPASTITTLPGTNIDGSVADAPTQFDAEEGVERVLDGAPSVAVGRGVVSHPLYRFGPFGRLVGRPVRAVAGAAEASAEDVVLTSPASLDDADLDRRSLPALVTGELTLSEPAEVVVALNGVVAGTGGASRDHQWLAVEEDAPPSSEDRYSFQVVVDPGRLRDGGNELELFLVREGDDEARLAPVAEEELEG